VRIMKQTRTEEDAMATSSKNQWQKLYSPLVSMWCQSRIGSATT
jgi:hypothetical protein